MKVYRVETEKAKLGPYRYISGFSGGWSDEMENFQPIPENDGFTYQEIDSLHHTDLFGFASMEQFREWFNASDKFVQEKQLPILFQHDFGLSEYEVDEEFVAKGNKQVIFDISKAVRIKHENLKSIFIGG